MTDDGSKIVLVVDDEPTVLRLLEAGLPPHLPDFDVVTARDGKEAVEYMAVNRVDVVVTDVHMPVMDGFALLAHARAHHPNLPVVVLSVMAVEDVERASPMPGALRVLRKPASAAVVARTVLEAHAETARGRLGRVPLEALVQLLRVERKTCSLLVRSGETKGRLHFLSGDLVNAYSFDLDVDGEAAARHLLALEAVTIHFERSFHNHERRIDVSLEQLLLEVALERDARARALADVEQRAAASEHQAGDGDDDTASGETGPADPADPGTREGSPDLDAAAAVLQHALASLRARAGATARLLDETSPRLREVAAAVAAVDARAAAGGGARVAAPRMDVTELAARLALAADGAAPLVEARGD